MCTVDEQHWERVRVGLAAMSREQRAQILVRSDYHAFRHEQGDWRVMGSSGVVGAGYASKEEAEDSIIEGTGIFDSS